MKKIFTAFLALAALGGILSGILNFNDIILSDDSTAYNNRS